jgi:hypothetical protein
VAIVHTTQTTRGVEDRVVNDFEKFFGVFLAKLIRCLLEKWSFSFLTQNLS